MSTYDTFSPTQLDKYVAFWSQLESALGDGWRLRGFTFDHIATFSDPHDTSHEIRGSLARRILEISERKS